MPRTSSLGTRKGNAKRSRHSESYGLAGSAAMARSSHVRAVWAAVESAAMEEKNGAGRRPLGIGLDDVRPNGRPGPGAFLARVRDARRRAARLEAAVAQNG